VVRVTARARIMKIDLVRGMSFLFLVILECRWFLSERVASSSLRIRGWGVLLLRPKVITAPVLPPETVLLLELGRQGSQEN